MRFSRTIASLPFAASMVLLAAAGSAQDGAAPPAAPATAPATPGAKSEAKKPAFPRLALQRVAPEMTFRRPVQVVFEPGVDARMYVLEQAGRVLVIDPQDRDAKEPTVFMDIRPQVNSRGNEEGLLSMAFHPDYAKNGTFFVYYTAIDAERRRRNVLSRWKVDPDTKGAKAGSEEVLLSVDDPYSNHNGGTVLFGRDGMLYLSCGDGGAANDPKLAGQDLGTLLAKVLRIDVDRPEGDRPYGIPKDNPFVGVDGARPEIWAYGLRNVWRMSFDRSTGELYAGDVGQNQYEEVDIITKGGNYGWNPREALHAFPGGQAGKFGSDYIDPVAEYPHSEGVSITGGFVCRGKNAGALDGVYLYADLVSCRIWGLRAEKGKLVAGPEVLHTTRNHLPTSFGQANDGTVYLVTFEGSQDPRAKGAVWRISAER
jgi:glucose/arabinose dehydrogenase